MILEMKGVEKSYDSNKVLKNINLKLKEGEITAVIGHSGAGKTTLLRCINGLEDCDKGSISIDGTYLCKEEKGRKKSASKQDMKLIRKKLGMVFQGYNLFPHKSVIENIIEAPINIYNVPRAKALKDAYELLKAMELEEKADAYPYQLSGGQKQRAAIARACALNPKIMCFDEPTSALDPELREGIASTMEKLASENMSILLISHDMSFVRRIADRILYMDAGEIIKEGRKDEFFSELSDERIKRFFLSA
jgi:polar amino acid transport system ATP-binding protein